VTDVRPPELRRQALGLLMPGFVGTELPDWLRALLADGLGGICLFGHNVDTPAQVAALTASIYSANPHAIIAIDEEGGDVSRLHQHDGSPFPGNAILGRIGGGGQSFLATERSFDDFILELDVKTELPGNSGIQIRSRETEAGRLVGYQIEIDPSERAWSGGLYYEGGEWVQNLEGNDAGRAAFVNGEWNHFRIECFGPTIRAWVNGIPTTTYADARDAAGVIGLQVHNGNNTRVRWRNIRLWE